MRLPVFLSEILFGASLCWNMSHSKRKSKTIIEDDDADAALKKQKMLKNGSTKKRKVIEDEQSNQNDARTTYRNIFSHK